MLGFVSVDYLQASDATLLRHIAQCDVVAFEALYDRHAQTVYNLIFRIERDAASAEATLQETFWQVWLKAGEFEGSGVAAAWIYRIARNKSLDQLRRQKSRPRPDEKTLDDHAATIVAQDEGRLSLVEAEVERGWTQRHVAQALLSLPDDQRLCLELAYFEGMSQRQIAEFTQTPLGTIKTRVRLAMEKMERLLRAAGYRAEDI